MSSDDGAKGPDYQEKSILLPRSLWARVDTLAERESKVVSEVVADALRMLLSRGGGGATAAPAERPAGGIAAIAEGGSPVLEDLATANALETRLAELYDEPLGSERLITRLQEIMARVETRDHFIDRHSEKVARLARTIGEALGVSSDDLAAIQTAALCHDLGKSRVPVEVLGKKGRLAPDEWTLIKRYPEFSGEMLTPFKHLGPVVPLVRHHQERWDGSGYPDALAGDDIPLGAQIVGVCDVFDVLTSDRAYRPALPPDVAVKTIEGGIGRLWKPGVAEALIKAAG